MAGGRTKGAKQDQYGTKIALVDRRREAWALRARGLSFRQIGEELGVAPIPLGKIVRKQRKNGAKYKLIRPNFGKDCFSSMPKSLAT